MPVFGHVPWSNFGLPFVLGDARDASRSVGLPSGPGFRSSTVSELPSVAFERDLRAVALLAAEFADAMPLTCCTSPRPGVGECGLNGPRMPSTFSARKLSSDARICPTFA
jgi:hypothetical protein